MRPYESIFANNGGCRLSAVGGHYGLLIILTAFTLLSLLYDFNVPFFEKPDELKHFALIQYLQTNGQLPIVKAGEYKPWDQEGTQPPLYHILAALATSWLDLSHFEEPPRNPHYADERSFIWWERGNNNLYLHAPGEEWSAAPVFLAARIARWLSLLAGIGTVGLTYFLARLVFVNERESESANERMSESVSSPLPPCPLALLLPLLAAALVAFVPQFLHTSTAISNDGLSVTIATAALLIMALMIKNGGLWRNTIYLGLVLGLGAITKLSLLYLIPLTGLVLLFDLYRHRSLRRFLLYGAIIGGLILLVAGWWYGRNWYVYGDITALNAHLLYRGGALNPQPSLAHIWQTELTGLELSFWAAFGAGQILFELWLYEVLGWVKYLVLLGFAIGVWRVVSSQLSVVSSQVSSVKCQVPSVRCQVLSVKCQVSSVMHHAPRTTLALLALWSLLIFIALLRWMQITPASWGRLLYPALPALSVLAVWSLSQFSVSGVRCQVSRLTPHLLPALLAGGLFLLSLVSPFYYLRAAYAKTPLISEAEVPAEGVERLDFTYDDSLRLLGYTVEKTSVRPGEWLPVTLYWQAARPIAKNYSVFAHLLGRENKVIGQINTYPQGGNWPTSLLEPGKVLKDTYFVPIEPDAAAPTVIRLAAGIFEFEDPARRAKPVVNAAGQKVDSIVGAIPLLPTQWPELKPSQPMQADFGGQIRLIGVDSIHGEVKAGTQFPITFYWETLAPPAQNLTLFIHLVDKTTQAQVAGFDGPPDFSTALWQPGYRLADSRVLHLPENLPAGDYEVRIGWYNPETLARLPLGDGSGDFLSLLNLTITN
ncbi:MAG: glycosyltransferase family 39 protein [Anaerolineae bacterium]